MRNAFLALLFICTGAYSQTVQETKSVDAVVSAGSATPAAVTPKIERKAETTGKAVPAESAAVIPEIEQEIKMIDKAVSANASAPVEAKVNTTQVLQQARDLKIGFVNFRRIMLEIPQFTDMRSTLDNEFRTDNERLLNEREKLANMESELGRMERNDAYIAFEKQVIAKRREVARQESAFRDAYSVRRNEEMAKLQTVVADEIVRLAKEEGFDIILNDIGVVYVSEEADLTSTVILRLQTRNR